MILFVSFANVFLAQSLEDTPDAAKLYNEGNKMLKSGNYSGAIEKFDGALQLVDDYRLYFFKGDAFRKLNKYDEAVKQYKTAIQKNSEYYPSYYYLGVSYFAQKDYESAKQYFNKTLEHTNSNKIKSAVQKNLEKIDEKIAFPYLTAGQQDMTNGDYNSAISNFKKVLEYSNSDVAYLGLADANVELGNYTAALDYASKAIAHRTDIAKGSPYYFLGVIYKNLGETEKAKQNFQSCLDDRSQDNIYRERAQFELKNLK